MAAFASWHEGHASAPAVLTRAPRIPAHVVIETFSVLTRLPPPHRAPADVVQAFLAARFGDAPLVLPARGHTGLIEMASREGLTGGAIYDALIAATVLHAGATWSHAIDGRESPTTACVCPTTSWTDRSLVIGSWC